MPGVYAVDVVFDCAATVRACKGGNEGGQNCEVNWGMVFFIDAP